MHKPENDSASIFQPVAPKLKKFRVSALYNTIAKLNQEKSSIFQSVLVQSTGSLQNSVFYLKFNKPPVNLLFGERSKENESHLTVHRSFKDNTDPTIRNGQSLAHYTETYFDHAKGTKTVAHVYFNCQADVMHTQVKVFSNDTIQGLKLDPEKEKLLIENATPALNLLRELLLHTDVLYKEKFKTTQVIESLLEEISQKLSANSYEQYIKTGERFIKAIEDCNTYCLSGYDNRGKIIAQQIRNLQNRTYHSLENHKLENEDEEELESGGICTLEEKQISTIATVEEDCNRIFEVIKTLNSALNDIISQIITTPNEATLLVKQGSLISEIRFNLLLISPYISQLNKTQKEYLEQNVKSNVKNNPTVLKLFLSQFWLGRIEVIEGLYPYIKNQLNFEIVANKLLMPFINIRPSNEAQEQKIKQLFKFLYDKSFIFRSFVGSRVALISVDSVDYMITALVYACKQKNLFAFQTLLEFGQSPNGVGALISGLQVPVLYMMAVTNTESDRFEFFKLAVEFGAIYDCCTSLFPSERIKLKVFSVDNKIPAQAKLHLQPTKSDRNLQELIQEFASYQNTIEIIYKFGGINLRSISLFLPQMKLYDQLNLMAILSSRSDVMQRHLRPTTDLKVKIAPVDEQELVTLATRSLDGINLHFSILFFTENTALLSLMSKLLTSIQKYIAQIKAHSPGLMKVFFDKALTIAKIYQQQAQDIQQILSKFKICLWLLYQDEPTFLTYQMILQVYCFMGKAAKKGSTPACQSVFQYYYSLAKTIAEETLFSGQLTKTAIYDHILKQIPEDEELVWQPCRNIPS